MIKTTPLSISTHVRRHHPRRCVTVAARTDNQARLTEVIAGRSAMYGVVFGSVNWALTGLDVIDQTHYVPFTLLGLASIGLASNTMIDADKKLTRKQFEAYAYRNVGRAAMLVFGYMFVGSLLN